MTQQQSNVLEREIHIAARPEIVFAFFTDPAKMYKTAKPDAVFIATPHTLHFDHGMQALDAGCHVYMPGACAAFTRPSRSPRG